MEGERGPGTPKIDDRSPSLFAVCKGVRTVVGIIGKIIDEFSVCQDFLELTRIGAI